MKTPIKMDDRGKGFHCLADGVTPVLRDICLSSARVVSCKCYDVFQNLT